MKNNKIQIVALFGPAGSGKDYLLNKIIEDNEELNGIISQTTRPPREGEKDGVNYYFKTVEQFKKDIKENNLLEWTMFRDWYYGTNYYALDDDVINIGVFNVEGIRTLLKDPRVIVYPVAIKTSAKTRLIRQLTREENPNIKEIFRRYDADERDFSFIDFHYNIISNEGQSNDGLIELSNFINSLH
jgi:guanylate kinase